MLLLHVIDGEAVVDADDLAFPLDAPAVTLELGLLGVAAGAADEDVDMIVLEVLGPDSVIILDVDIVVEL
jgi:hypothetical protein